MKHNDKAPKKWWYPSLMKAVIIGAVIIAATVPLSVARVMRQTLAFAENASDALKQQCASFSKVVAADRTKGLFRMTDLLRDFRNRLADEPELVNDAFLEEYVDSLRISGVVLINDKLETEVSGYTRQYRNAEWVNTELGMRFSDILTHPSKIFAERVEANGEYYDLCAMARKDAAGIIVGFYHQPSGLISDSESDLESMLSGLYLENSGHYVIFSDETVSATSDQSFQNKSTADSDMLYRLANIKQDGKIHQLLAGGHHWWVYRSACEGYKIAIYYPMGPILYDCLVSVAVVGSVYLFVCVLLFSMRNRVLYENQEKLRESNRQLTETVNMLKSLETIYFCLIYVDIENNRYETVYLAPWLERIIPHRGIFTELKRLLLNMMVVDKFRREIDHVMSYGYIRENLSRSKITDFRRSFYADYQAIRGDEIRWCRISATVADYDDEGKPRHILALIQDVDSEKTKEAEYQSRIEKEAREARIANNAKSEFLRRISHDIRTPINGIRGYIELSAAHPDDPDVQKHCRDSATTALNTLLELVNSLFEMSRLENGDIILDEKPFDITEMLEEVNVVLIPQAQEKGISYEILRKGEFPVKHFVGSPRHVKQILYNLTTNAVKYGRSGGYVRVNTRMISRTDDAAEFEFTCSDNGVGMSEEFQKHLFEPFSQEAQTARTTYQGTGLGLSIVKKLVDALGGSISCRSEKNVGTTFTVRLTFRIDKDHRGNAETAADYSGSCLNGVNILLVEDNELNMEIAELMLTDHGAAVTKAWNGQEAVDAFKASDVGFYGAICMDIMMPVMDGITAAHTIRSLDRADADTVPILAMSANAFPDDVTAGIEAGISAHLAKPLVINDVLAAISRFCKNK